MDNSATVSVLADQCLDIYELASAIAVEHVRLHKRIVDMASDEQLVALLDEMAAAGRPMHDMLDVVAALLVGDE